ncbi:hypothetical protein ACOI8A_27830, partial [Pseudomonas sp. P4795]|uniref:hypothetical protein n=1 Tax=Pseudomonas sp. P4795 TaxID=3409915 RepID=UPI003B59CEFF
FSISETTKSAQEVAQYCATSCALGYRPFGVWPVAILGGVLLWGTAQLLAHSGVVLSLRKAEADLLDELSGVGSYLTRIGAQFIAHNSIATPCAPPEKYQ